MYGCDAISTSRNLQALQNRGVFRQLGRNLLRKVHHKIAHYANARGNALARKLLGRMLIGYQQQVADMVCDDAVNLFGHGAIE